MIDFIYLGVSPSSCAIACAHNLNHHIYSSPWISSTSPLAFWTPQTKTEPGQPVFGFAPQMPFPACSRVHHQPRTQIQYPPHSLYSPYMLHPKFLMGGQY